MAARLLPPVGLDTALRDLRDEPELSVTPKLPHVSFPGVLGGEPSSDSGSGGAGGSSPAAPTGRSVLELSVNHVLGARRSAQEDVLLLQESSLVPGGQQVHLYRHGNHVEKSYVESLPEELKTGVYYVRADVNDAMCSGTQDYMVGMVKAYVRFYILYPSTMQAPPWLRAGFRPLKGNHVVRMSWSLNLGSKLLFWLGRCLDKVDTLVLKVWQSRRVYHPGDSFAWCGADGSGELLDKQYVLAFRSSDVEGELEALFDRHTVDVDAELRTSRQIVDLVQKRDAATVSQMLLTSAASLALTYSGNGVAVDDEDRWERIVDSMLTERNCLAVKALMRSPDMAPYFASDRCIRRVHHLAVTKPDMELLMLLFSPERLRLELDKG